MKTKSNKRVNNFVNLQRKFLELNFPAQKPVVNFPVPHPFDLFGETSVTIDEVNLWMKNVPKMDQDSPRFDWYVKNWAVVDKIKAVKVKFITVENYFLIEAANMAKY